VEGGGDQTNAAAMIVTTSKNPTTHSADAEKLHSRMAFVPPLHPKLDGPIPRKV
jgi:hypothetical protein